MSSTLACFSHRIFECVRLPATGTKGFLVAVRINPAFDAYVTFAAQNWLRFGHDACSFEQRRLDHGIRICDENRASDSMLATALKPRE
jgi:hypothetical protein